MAKKKSARKKKTTNSKKPTHKKKLPAKKKPAAQKKPPQLPALLFRDASLIVASSSQADGEAGPSTGDSTTPITKRSPQARQCRTMPSAVRPEQSKRTAAPHSSAVAVSKPIPEGEMSISFASTISPSARTRKRPCDRSRLSTRLSAIKVHFGQTVRSLSEALRPALPSLELKSGAVL